MRKSISQKLAILFIVIALAVFAGLLFGAEEASADCPGRVNERKFFTSYTVKSGDTLWDIAGHYMTEEYTDTYEYIREITTSNHLDSTDIYPGQLLVLPYYADKPMY